MERHSKGEFYVLRKKLKLFDQEFLFKHIATRHFDFSQRFVFNWLYSAISLADNATE